ncbi:MAG: hypothetical protein AAF556_06935, partial [Pseudomonadota bacterium]
MNRVRALLAAAGLLTISPLVQSNVASAEEPIGTPLPNTTQIADGDGSDGGWTHHNVDAVNH